ncbi:MAG: hypothetical protein R2838_25700 [Caldilineaceae bacterium]
MKEPPYGHQQEAACSKSKRPSSKSTSRNYGDLYKDKATACRRTIAATAESAAPSVRDANWGTEYAYVLGDLRRYSWCRSWSSCS